MPSEPDDDKFVPSSWIEDKKKPILPDHNPFIEARKRTDDALARIARATEMANQVKSTYDDINNIIARINRIEQMIEGASISCSGSTITLTWGT